MCGRGATETPAPCPSTPPHAPKWEDSLNQRHGPVAVRRVFHIHDPITHGIEDPRVEGLREEVSKIINGVDKGNIDALLFDEFAYEEMPALDVFGLLMVLRIVSQVD